ncbi:thioredoxin [Candidatus Roizmanbacteria bacterium]|nr:thioredoxin [Candidatus Roizmanbacteria bacterium]
MAVTTVTKDIFQEEVIKAKGAVFVDFYADWCGPCKLTAPIIDKLADEIKEMKFVKINVDENNDTASQYSVFSIPTFIIFKNGQVVSQFVGAMGKEGFEAEIKKALTG